MYLKDFNKKHSKNTPLEKYYIIVKANKLIKQRTMDGFPITAYLGIPIIIVRYRL
jgi:hypothetical protein